jgi:hypothetical protein
MVGFNVELLEVICLCEFFTFLVPVHLATHCADGFPKFRFLDVEGKHPSKRILGAIMISRCV